MLKNTSNHSNHQALMFASVWAVLQLTRIVSFFTIQSIAAGSAPVEWLYPSIVDVLIGLSAPLIAFFIWRKNGAWTRLITLIWFSVSLLERIESIGLNMVSLKPHAFFGDTQSAIALELAIFALLDAVALFIVAKQSLKENPATAGKNAKSRGVVIAVVVWAVLQIPRYIAIPIIQNIFSGGTDHPAWLIPALGDIVIASLSFVVIYAFWKKQGFWVWAFTLLWLALSIYDHLSTVVATIATPGPQIFGGGTTPNLANLSAPGSQAVIDALFFIYLAREKIRLMFMSK
ncbi:MAG TPA: hypothetical protein PK299_03215 [Anaerolineales bacterium]|nr:hypothetical protein [Anaerolineales bacterium]